MTQSNAHVDEAAFLRGGGVMGTLIAQHDWASTPLGALSAWSQTLKTAMGILLRAPLPMALMWGEDGVLLYNDSYAALIGRHHPAALGSKVLESWPDRAELNGQALRAGLAGESRVFRSLELTVDRSGKPEQVWLDLDYSPVPDESGRPAGVLAICVEATGRVLAERRAAHEADRYRRLFEKAPGFITLFSGPNHVFEFVNEAYRRLFDDREVGGKPLAEVYADTADWSFMDEHNRVYATGERIVHRAQRTLITTQPGGLVKEHFLDYVLEPVLGEHGEVTGIFVEGFDVTEQVRAQAAVEESHRRLNAAMAIARLGVFEIDIPTGLAALDARACEIFGFGPDERVTLDDITARIEDYHAFRARTLSADAASQMRREREFRIHLPDGSVRDILSLSESIAGPDGRPMRTVGVFDDVTERRRAEQRQKLLINELNHRVKNTLATVQSIASQTLRSAPNLPSAREMFESRLMALARAHDLLTAESWRGARLADVAAGAMAPFESTQRPQIIRSGPPVWLTAHRALALGLALHELASNAAKYGALSVPEGRVTIRWSVSGDELTLHWVEEGGPPVVAPVHAGFGTRLLQRSLARELGGVVAATFAPEGVRCEVRFTVQDVHAAAH